MANGTELHFYVCWVLAYCGACGVAQCACAIDLAPRECWSCAGPVVLIEWDEPDGTWRVWEEVEVEAFVSP